MHTLLFSHETSIFHPKWEEQSFSRSFFFLNVLFLIEV